MTLDSWLSRALRRALATIAMVFVAEVAFYQAMHARVDLPPVTINRIEVVTMDGRRTITDRDTIDRVLAIVRSHRGEWTRYPDNVCLLGSPGASFYEGAARRGSIILGSGAIVIYTHRVSATRMLSRRDAAELQRLLAP